MTAEEYVALREAREGHSQRTRDGWLVTCPAHADRTPSLHVTEGDDGRVLLHCHAGCSAADVVAADGLEWGDLFDHRDGRQVEVAVYRDEDENGTPLFEVGRFEGKRFLQRRPGRDDWKGGIKGVRRVPFHLPQLIAGVAAKRTAYLPEGEKDVLALEAQGVVATCSPMGAGNWRDEYAQYLAGADVVVIADRDDPGYTHARDELRSLDAVAATVKVVEAAEGNDVSDHLAAGRTLGDLVPVDLEPKRPLGELLRAAVGLDDRPPLPTAPTSDANGLLVDMAAAMQHAHDPIPYLLEPIAVQGLVTVVVGRHSSMKSFLMMLGAAAVHQGAGQLAGFPVTQGPALYLDAEMGPRVMARRFVHAGLDADAFHVADGFRLRLPESRARIAALIRDTGARLVVMDSLRRLAPGAREDKSDDMSPIMAALAELSRELDVAIVLIHHRSTKENAAETRGSSSIEDQADIVFAFERVKDDPDEQRRRLRTVKFRPDEEPPPSWVRVKAGFRFKLEEAEPFEGEPVPPRPRDEHRDRVLAALGLSPRSGRKLADDLNINESTARRVLHDLEADGEARQTPDGWVRHMGLTHPDAPVDVDASEGVPHHFDPYTGTQADAPPKLGSTMRDWGASPPPAPDTPPDAPSGASPPPDAPLATGQ